jgi:excisionase family DNA binding protein
MYVRMNKFYSPEDLAALLSVDNSLVLNLIESGQLRAHRIGEFLRIEEAEFRKYLDAAVVSAAACVGIAAREVPPASADGRKECPTFGGQAAFTYSGSVAQGTTIWPGKKGSYKLQFDAGQWQLLLETFRGKEFRAGLNFAKPEPGSLGEWIKQHWNTKMGPAAYVGGILIAEGYADRPRPGWIRVFGEQKK